MPDLDELIAKSFINQEHEETKAQQIEERIRKIHNIDPDHIPKRTWGQPFDASKLSLTAKALIERGDPQLASFLGCNSGYHSRQEEIKKLREEASERLIKKTEELREKNRAAQQLREYGNVRGLNIATGGFQP